MFSFSRLFLAVGAAAFSLHSLAAGLEITQHGVKEMGHAFAGSATLLEDASAIANNPAGLMKIKGQQFSGGVSVIHAQLDYDVKVISERVEEKWGVPAREVNGPGHGQSNQISPVPHLYYANRLNDQVAVGFGIYVPFASGSEFPIGWAGRYHSEETSQQVINLNPVVAVKVNDRLSLGFGLVGQIYKAYLTNQIDVGYLVAESILDTVAEDPTKGYDIAVDLATPVLDKYGSNPNYQVHNEMDISSFSYGFNFGALWEYSERLTLGLNYRSGTTHVAKGDAKRSTLDQVGFKEGLITDLAMDAGYDYNEAAEKLGKAFDERGALGGKLLTQVYLPQILTLSADYRLTDKLDLMGSFTWVDWSVFKEMRLEYVDSVNRGGADITGSGDDVRRRDLVQPLHFKDSIRIGVGARYQLNNEVVLRAGLSKDNTPLTNANYRTPRGPDSNRTILGLGASYRWSEKMDFDIAYGSVRLAKASVNARENPAGTQHRAEGSSKGVLNTFGMQVNYNF